jgi:hypothetical protein
VFGWRKTPQLPADALAAAQIEAKTDGKGRATPKRREAEQRNRRPLGATSSAAKPGATRAERRAARMAQRDAMHEERARTRQALLTGDEANLPPRDKGPARRFARDYVDARYNVGEYFLPAAIVVLLVGLIQIPIVQNVTLVLIWGLGLLAFSDGLLLRRKINKLTAEKYGATAATGTGFYAMVRSLQIRRTRLPRPQVKRGDFPR